MPQVRALPGHVRTRHDQELLPLAVQTRVIGHEGFGDLRALDHRMPAVLDLDPGRLVHFRLRIVELDCDAGEAPQHINLRDGPGGLQHPLALLRHLPPHLAEQLVLQVLRLLLRAQDLGLDFLQLGCDEALRVDQRLLALIRLGRQVQVRLCDLDVVSEDPVEAHLERFDPRPGSFLVLEASDPLAPVGHGLAQLVQLGGEAVANHPTLCDCRGRILGDGLLKKLRDILQLINVVPQLC